MSDERAYRYDTFVIRLWRTKRSNVVIRAEIEHVQTGRRSMRRWSPELASEGGPERQRAWIAEQLVGEEPDPPDVLRAEQ